MTSPDYEGLALELEREALAVGCLLATADRSTTQRRLLDRATEAIRTLVAERDRLEGALRFYADEPAFEFPSDGPWGVNSDDFGLVARAALSGRKEP